MRYVIRMVLALALAGFQMAPAGAAEKRVALVIGNGSYAHIPHLRNVPNDADAMANLFKSAKFDAVDVKHNLSVAELRGALREFAGRTADADVAVLFYAGHGIEVGQVNYLIPVDARLVTDYDVEDETISLDRVLQAMEPAKRLRLVLLDACRENPFLKSMRSTVAARSVGRGLGRVEPSTTNTLIAYATKPNAIAEDGKGPNSPFTAALVRHLLTPGRDLRIALGHVRDEVLKSTARKQEPYVTGSLGGGIVSIGGEAPKPDTLGITAPPIPTPVTPPSDAARAWAAAKESTDIAVLEAFRRQYGASNAFYDQLAQARIEDLKKQHISMLKAERDRELAEEEKKRVQAAAKNKADEEARAKVDAERKRVALPQQEETRKRAEADTERKRLAALKAEEDRRRVDAPKVAVPPKDEAPVTKSEWNGTWTGSWTASSPTSITIAEGKVVRYLWRGQSQSIGTTRVVGNVLSFGNDNFRIRMRLEAPGRASANYSGPNGHGQALLTRQ